MNKVLVTGGSGFIGTNVVSRLLDMKYHVLNIDIKPPIKSEHLFCYKYIDMKSFSQLSEAIADFEPNMILHLAARTDLNGKKLSDYEDNIIPVENLCKIITNSPFVNRVIFTSSMLVCRAGYIPADSEDYCPTTVYGESKVETENIVKKYKNVLPSFCIVRPTSIWGPWFKEPYRDFFDMVLAGRFFRIGKPSCTKTYGYVGNTVNQIISLLSFKEEKSNDNVYYLGDSPPNNIDDWSVKISELAEKRKPIILPFFLLKVAALIGDLLIRVGVKFPLSSFRLKNMTTNNVLDCTKVISCNKWEPIPLEHGIKATLNWMKEYKVMK